MTTETPEPESTEPEQLEPNRDQFDAAADAVGRPVPDPVEAAPQPDLDELIEKAEAAEETADEAAADAGEAAEDAVEAGTDADANPS